MTFSKSYIFALGDGYCEIVCYQEKISPFIITGLQIDNV